VASWDSVARRYARALLMLAKEQNQVEELGAELKSLVGFFEQYPELFHQILSPQILPEERENIIKTLSSQLSLSELMTNFLLLLNQKRRFAIISRIARVYEQLSDELSGIARAEVYSAQEIDSSLKEKLINILEKKLNKKVVAKFFTDPELIGGVKVKVGSILMDGSIRAQLKMLEDQLKGI